MAVSRQVEVDGRELKLTNLDKVLYPKAGFTKGEMVDYYAKVADAMVPHLSGRAVTLRRFRKESTTSTRRSSRSAAPSTVPNG